MVDAHAERRGGVDEVESWPSLPRWEMKAVLQELATAVRSGMLPSADGRVVVVVLEPLAVDDDRASCTAPRCPGCRPARSSASELTVLNVEPGAYCPYVAML